MNVFKITKIILIKKVFSGQKQCCRIKMFILDIGENVENER